jgi:hypothetical protein
MEMKPMAKDLPFALMFTDSINRVPHVHGYADEESRDAAYEQFIETGTLTIRDDNLGGIQRTVHPVYVVRMNMVDGTVNHSKVFEEINGLAFPNKINI